MDALSASVKAALTCSRMLWKLRQSPCFLEESDSFHLRNMAHFLTAYDSSKVVAIMPVRTVLWGGKFFA